MYEFLFTALYSLTTFAIRNLKMQTAKMCECFFSAQQRQMSVCIALYLFQPCLWVCLQDIIGGK